MNNFVIENSIKLPKKTDFGTRNELSNKFTPEPMAQSHTSEDEMLKP